MGAFLTGTFSASRTPSRWFPSEFPSKIEDFISGCDLPFSPCNSLLTCRSYQIAHGLLEAHPRTGCERFPGATGIDFVSDHSVFICVDFFQQSQPEIVELVFVQVAFEHAVLDTHAVVLAYPGDLGQAFVIGDIVATTVSISPAPGAEDS